MSLQPHRLSSCCGVPVMGNENAERGICSNCKQPCNIDVIDDGERSYLLRMAAIKRKSIADVTKQVIVTGFCKMDKKLTVQFKDRLGRDSHCTINNSDFFTWASANSYLALLPEVEYVEGEHWDKQPHDMNRRLNVTELVRFYNRIDKHMLEDYLNAKIPQHYAETA